MKTKVMLIKQVSDKAIFAWFLLLLSTAGLAPMAAAQEDTGADTAADTDIEEVIVTGSRLRRDRDFVAISPVQTIGLDEIQSAGNVTLEETLNKYPQLVPANTSVSNQSGGTGVLAANLRALGPVRTLVLVDGRRFIPADVTGLTDVATIPDMLIQRVEIVTGGASAVYGSDAIAGAVNFILRDDFEGAEFSYQFGETSKSDGASNKFDLLLGANVADGRGNVTLHGSYTERDEIFFPERDFSAVSLLADGDGVLQELKLPTIPGGLITIPATEFDQIQGVDLIGAQATCSGPVEGVRFGEGSVPLPFCRPTDGYDFPALNYLQRPLERYQITALGSFEINDRVEVYSQLAYTDKQNAYQQAPDAVRPRSPGQETGTLILPDADTNPLFPQVLQDFFGANQAFFDPDGDGIYTVRNIAYRAEQLGPRTVTTLANSYHFSTGLRGDFELVNRSWFWDTFYQYSKTDVNQIFENRLSQTRVTLGLDTEVNIDGQTVCRAGGVLGCVPINFFGTDGLTEDMIRFLRVSAGQQDRLQRQVAGATVAGDLFELPAGPVASAFGFEWRKEEFRSVPNQTNISGEIGAPPFPVPTDGEYDMSEFFAEIRVPLLQGLPAVESLAIEGAVRLSDYSTIGSVSSWKGAVDWQLLDWVRFRGGVSRAIRAPNLNELFAQQSLGFDGGSVDPCVVTSSPTPAEQELCILQGVPPELADSLPQVEPGFFSRRGGNPNLTEEEADTLTLGVVFSPMPELSLAFDYFDIEIDQAITSVAGQVVVDTCFSLLDINTVECQSIHRLLSGQIDFVEASLLNVAKRGASGLDVTVDYSIDLPDVLALPGNNAGLSLSLVATSQFEQTTQVVVTQPEIECSGYFGAICSSDLVRITPELSGLLRATWDSGPASLNVQFNYIGGVDLHPDAGLLEIDSVSAKVYMDLNGGYRFNDNFRLFGGIKNVFDEDPPILGLEAGGDSNTNVETYDPLGRRFFIGTTIGFY